MKVWRVISLTLWGIILTVLLLVSSAHFLLTYTVLDQSKATGALKQTSFYTALRTEAVLPAIEKQIPSGATGGAILQQKEIQAATTDVFTTSKVQAISDQILTATYNWLDKKSPDLEFTVPITSEKQAFLAAITTRVSQNIAALPACDRFADISDSLATATCLPPYMSRAEITETVMNEVTTMLRNTPDTLTAETVGLTPREMGRAVNLPDYISYLWALNLVTLPLALIISLYLLLKRHGAGLITISAAVLILGAAGLGGVIALQNANGMESTNILVAETLKASKVLIVPVLTTAGGIGLGVGVLGIIGGIVWQKSQSD